MTRDVGRGDVKVKGRQERNIYILWEIMASNELDIYVETVAANTLKKKR